MEKSREVRLANHAKYLKEYEEWLAHLKDLTDARSMCIVSALYDNMAMYQEALYYSIRAIELHKPGETCTLPLICMAARAHARISDTHTTTESIDLAVRSLESICHASCASKGRILLEHAKAIVSKDIKQSYLEFRDALNDTKGDGWIDTLKFQYRVYVYERAVAENELVFAVMVRSSVPAGYSVKGSTLYLIKKLKWAESSFYEKTHCYSLAMMNCTLIAEMFASTKPEMDVRIKNLRLLFCQNKPLDNPDRYRWCMHCRSLIDRQPLIEKGVDFVTCGYCYKDAYCSKEHYLLHWPIHSKLGYCERGQSQPKKPRLDIQQPGSDLK